MGGFARIALPVAASIAAPYAGAALAGTAAPIATAAGAAALGVAPGTALSMSQLLALSGPIGLGSAGYTTAAGVSTLGTLVNAGLTGLGQLNQIRQERLQQQMANARNAAEAARIRQQFDINERRRREQLRRSVAAQRARLGAAGVGSASGSGAAIIGGLQREADQRTREDIDALDQRFSAQRRLSLLEQSSRRNQVAFQTLRKTLSPFVNLLD